VYRSVLSFPLLPVPLYTTFSAQQKKTALINKSALPELLLKITLAVHNHKKPAWSESELLDNHYGWGVVCSFSSCCTAAYQCCLFFLNLHCI